jgi:hypothetical protein
MTSTTGKTRFTISRKSFSKPMSDGSNDLTRALVGEATWHALEGPIEF